MSINNAPKCSTHDRTRVPNAHQHIKKEDAVFFPNTEKYFTADELDRMLEEFWEFDRKMIHEKYRKLVVGLDQERK